MNRRDTVFALAALSVQPAAVAQQQGKVWRVGILANLGASDAWLD